MIKCKTEYTKKSLRDFVIFQLKPVIILFSIIAGISLVLGIVDVADDSKDYVGFFVVAAFLVIISLIIFLINISTNKQNIGIVEEFAFDDEVYHGREIKNGVEQIRFKARYNTVYAIRLNQNYIYIYPTPQMAYIIHKDSFKSYDELNYVVNKILSNCKTTKNTKKGTRSNANNPYNCPNNFNRKVENSINTQRPQDAVNQDENNDDELFK